VPNFPRVSNGPSGTGCGVGCRARSAPRNQRRGARGRDESGRHRLEVVDSCPGVGQLAASAHRNESGHNQAGGSAPPHRLVVDVPLDDALRKTVVGKLAKRWSARSPDMMATSSTHPSRSARNSSQVRRPTAWFGVRLAPARYARAALPGIRSGMVRRCLPRARR
jgi:hypothetical protein